MTLYFCEKPSQAADIARVLGATKKSTGYFEGNGVKVTWGLGHLLEQSAPDAYGAQFAGWKLDTLPIIPEAWKIEVTQKAKSQFAVVKALIGQAQHVVIATDADREGEVIAREVLEYVRYNKRISRLWTSALDDVSLRNALANLRDGKSTEALYYAGRARSHADWLVGMNLTRAYTCKANIQSTLSVGRVQTTTLFLVVRRDLEIENFTPEEYFEITASFSAAAGGYSAKWLPPATSQTVAPDADNDPDGNDDEKNKSKAWPKCFDRSVAEQALKTITGATGQIIKADTQRKQQEAPLPFDLPSLQKYASAKWGYSLKLTLDTAQSLYSTHKVTSYPRVECRFLPSSQYEEVPGIMASLATSDENYKRLIAMANLNRMSPAWNDKAIESGAEAHHGIIPTAAIADLKRMTTEERNIYDAICKHYIAQFYSPYTYDATVIDTDVAGYIFRCSGAVPVNHGWKVIFGVSDQDSKLPVLPAVKQGESAVCVNAKISTERTAPPPRYTQGTLADDMKNIHRHVDDPSAKAMLKKTKGIGTPATRDSIIENLFHKQYIDGQKQIISTTKGREFIAVVSKTTPDLVDPAMTGKWEMAFDRIASGVLPEEKFTATIKTWVMNLVSDVKQAGELGMTTSEAGPPCPICKGPTVSRRGRNGNFYGCKSYPDCKGIANTKNTKTVTVKSSANKSRPYTRKQKIA